MASPVGGCSGYEHGGYRSDTASDSDQGPGDMSEPAVRLPFLDGLPLFSRFVSR